MICSSTFKEVKFVINSGKFKKVLDFQIFWEKVQETVNVLF